MVSRTWGSLRTPPPTLFDARPRKTLRAHHPRVTLPACPPTQTLNRQLAPFKYPTHIVAGPDRLDMYDIDLFDNTAATSARARAVAKERRQPRAAAKAAPPRRAPAVCATGGRAR